MTTNKTKVFFKNEDDKWWFILYKLITATKSETRKQLLELENELREQNRFFPKGKIIEGIDAIAESVYTKLDAGTLIYRCRTIDKYHEDDFTKELNDEVETYLKGVYPGFRMEDGEDALMDIHVFLSLADKELDYSALEARLARFKERGWWGYDEKNSDAPPHQSTRAGRINPAGISYLVVE